MLQQGERKEKHNKQMQLFKEKAFTYRGKLFFNKHKSKILVRFSTSNFNAESP